MGSIWVLGWISTPGPSNPALLRALRLKTQQSCEWVALAVLDVSGVFECTSVPASSTTVRMPMEVHTSWVNAPVLDMCA